MTKSEIRDRLMRDKDTLYGVSMWCCKCGQQIIQNTIVDALKHLDKQYIGHLGKCWKCQTVRPPIRLKTFTEHQYKKGRPWDQKWCDKHVTTVNNVPDLVVAAPKKWYE